MSEEISHQKSADLSQTTDKRSSNMDYDEYVNRIQSNCGIEKPVVESVKCAPVNAEDEVVAILLSAMMGSIVKCWERKALEKDEQYSSFFTTKHSGEFAPLKLNSQVSVMEQPISKITLHSKISHAKGKETVRTTKTKGSRGSSMNQTVAFPSFGELTQSFDKSQSNVSTHTRLNTKPTIRDAEEQSLSTQLRRIRTLLISEKENVYGWEFLGSEQYFNITFNQGNRYEGKLLNCRMHGKGRFFWEDGSMYEGEFFHGKMTGNGIMHWPDESWYEGEFIDGFRHGRGLHVDHVTFYAGYWKDGRRHGVGAMFYNHLNTQVDYYNGEWLGDLKHNTGLRSYPSGAMYSGQWSCGKRHGLGTMVWTNGDVYSGNFEKGKMHGYGEYTWDTFYNKQLVLPEENCYYGEWRNGVRHGNGTLETTAGVIVKGSWENGKKNGPAEVICSNGNFLYADNLFQDDCFCLDADHSFEADSLMNASMQSAFRLPVSAASHDIDLTYYVNRLMKLANEDTSLGSLFEKTYMDGPVETKDQGPRRSFMTQSTTFSRNFEFAEYKLEFHEEETQLRNVVMQFLAALKVIYNMYANVCCEVKPNFSTILTRLMWWQLLRDCNLHSKGLSLAHFDTCIANNKACLVHRVHYPFEKLLFWQFLHCLIEVSWELYGKNSLGTSSIKGIIASGLHKLITSDLIPNAGRHVGNALFKCKDLLSIDSVYRFYTKVGEPHSAREFLKNALFPQENDPDPKSEPKYHEYQIRGKNIFGVGGKLTYFPNEEPLLTGNKYQDDQSHPQNLSCLSSLGLPSILKTIILVCTSISTGELIVNMDYKIVFLEFYEILLLCAIRKARRKISARKKAEQEQQSVVTAPEDSANEVPSTQVEEVPSEKSIKLKATATSKKSKKKK